MVSRLERARNQMNLCQAYGVVRSSYNSWAAGRSRTKREKVKQFTKVRSVYSLSVGSAGISLNASMLATEGVPISRYLTSKCAKKLSWFVASCLFIVTIRPETATWHSQTG